MKKSIAIILTTAMVLNLFTLLPIGVSAEELPKADATTENTKNVESTGMSLNIIEKTYSEFSKENEKVARPTEKIVIDLATFISEGTDKNKLVDNFLGKEGKSLYTDEKGSVSFKVNVPSEGMYALNFDYIAGNSRGGTVEKDVKINGEIQFKEAQDVLFQRLYEDKKDEVGKKDAAGNDIKPSQVEIQKWQNVYLRDSQAYFSDPLLFKLKAGENTITFTSKNEPVTFGSMALTSIPKLKSYEEVKADYDKKGYKLADADPIEIEAERATLKSDTVLYPLTDFTSPATQPYESGKTLLNTIGGTKWQSPRQFMVWTVDVKKAGLYNITLKERQNIIRGASANRAIYIDNEIPYKELDSYKFYFSTGWKQETLKQEDDKPYMIYLSEGTHEIKMEVAMGIMSEQINKVDEILKELNTIYRKIMIITGSAPDKMRDYKLGQLIPEDIKRLGTLADGLEEVRNWFVEYTGGKGQNDATLNTNVVVLKRMAADPNRVPSDLTFFKANIGALATWILNIKQLPLELDYITLTSKEDPKFKKPSATIFEQVSYDVTQFFGSFSNDYGSIGAAANEEKVNDNIKVWIPTGRDQAQVLRKLVDNSFIPNTNIGVKLELVNMGALLPATVAGIGPDVAINMAEGEPINYAIRNAVVDLKTLPGYQEVANRFLPERMVPFTFNDSVYALPETQTYNVMFYRQDILTELGISIPQTWEDVVSIIPLLQKNNMTFGLPVSATKTPGAGNTSFFTLLMQNGGSVYNENGSSCVIDNTKGLESFKKWTNMYTNYSLPQDYDFLARFRTGEAPLAINDFSGFNSLVVSAPEIRGLWGFTLMPGTMREDGIIDRSVPFGGTTCFIISKSEKIEQSWEFLKWWTGKEAQLNFGKEMESVLGASARYATANVEALREIPWAGDLYKILEDQMQWGKGVPQVPGSYFIARHIDNAFRKVVISKGDQKEALSDYTYTINQEILSKREEFGLDN